MEKVREVRCRLIGSSALLCEMGSEVSPARAVVCVGAHMGMWECTHGCNAK